MKTSVMTAGAIYEIVSKLRKEIDELNNALTLVDDEIGRSNAAYSLLLKQKEDKFKELLAFEKQVFTQGALPVNPFMADTPASRPF